MSLTSYEQRMEHVDLRRSMERHGLMPDSKSIVMQSLLDPRRMAAIIAAMDAVRNVSGDTAEIGCAGGGTSLLIAKLNGGRQHWACDTFDGLADCGDNDDLQNRDFRSGRCTYEIVRERLSGQSNIYLFQGYFPACVPTDLLDRKFAFVHIDVDTYQSIHSSFAFFSGRMARGGIIAIDDVIGRGTRGGIKAWDEINAAARARWVKFSEADPQVIVRFL